ncbi:MAG: outer membrane protein assembly factor BamB [Gammaproteobacteria bacterium]|nr:outer membrane protein assembly factor BamB [Gammaproteobacteria bacterium]
MKQLLRVSILMFAAVWLSGCSWLRGDDNAEPPAELTDIQAKVKLEERWSKDVGADTDELFLRLRPAVDGGRVFAADRKGHVRAYDATNGQEFWETDAGIMISSGVGVGDSLVLVGSSDAEVVALDWRDGHEVWRTRVSSEVLSVPGADQGTVVVQSVDGKLTGLKASDGSRIWVFDRSVPVLSLRGTSSPLLTQGVVIAAADNGKLAVLDMARGLPAWETSVAVPHGRSELERMVDIDAAPQVWGKTIYTVSYQGRVVALDGESGREVWARDMSSAAGLGVDLSNVYVTDDVSHVWALERDNGTSVWKQDKLAHRSLTAPVAFGDYVAVADFEGYVHLLARGDGELVGRARADRKGVLAPLVVDGDTLYVYGNGGTLTAYRIAGE